MTPARFQALFGSVIAIAVITGVIGAILHGSSDPLLYPALPAAIVGACLWIFSAPMRSKYVRGMTLTAQGKYQAARETFLEFRREKPDDPISLDGKIFVHLTFNEDLEAVAAAQRAVNVKSKHVPLFMRGQALAHVGALDDALADFTATYVERKLPMFTVYMAYVLINQRRLESAVGYLERAAWTVNSSYPLILLAEAYRLLGRTQDARSTYLDAVDVARRIGRPALALHSAALAALGDVDDAERMAREQLEQLPSDLVAMGTLLNVHAARDDREGALVVAKEMASISPHAAIGCLQDPAVTFLMSDVRFRQLYVACVERRRERIHEAHMIVKGAVSEAA